MMNNVWLNLHVTRATLNLADTIILTAYNSIQTFSSDTSRILYLLTYDYLNFIDTASTLCTTIYYQDELVCTSLTCR